MPLVDALSLPGSERVRLTFGRGFFPVVAVTNDGALLAVYRDGGGHGGHGGFLIASRSEDAGATWSDAVTVVKTEEYDDRNPALGVAADGTATVAYLANGSYGFGGAHISEDRRDPKNRHTGIVHSTDGGRTWGEPMIWTDATEWDDMSPFGFIVTASDGSMAMPIYWDDRSMLLWSRDNGYTWGDLRLVANDINEAAYCVLPDGRWLCMGRNVEEPSSRMLLSRWSDDGGKTWSDSWDFYPGWRYPADLSVLSDGSVLACYGFREPPHGVRARRSTDGGRTWSKAELIIDDLSLKGDCGYPATALVDGWVVTVYYSAGDFANFTDPTQAYCEAVRYREQELIAALEA